MGKTGGSKSGDLKLIAEAGDFFKAEVTKALDEYMVKNPTDNWARWLKGRAMLAAMRPGAQDARDAVANLLHLAGLRPNPPRFERFGYIEKAEYWALVWGTVVMTVTGVVLWFENQSLRWLDKWVLDLATIVHYYEAWLAFLAIMVWHVYQTVLNPDVYPMNWTWITGRISEEQLRHEHGAEWERLKAEEESEARRKADGPDPERPAGD